jgi:hypothetical protein
LFYKNTKYVLIILKSSLAEQFFTKNGKKKYFLIDMSLIKIFAEFFRMVHNSFKVDFVLWTILLMIFSYYYDIVMYVFLYKLVIEAASMKKEERKKTTYF